MIEPQNSLVPLPAEPRPADAPQGDGMGFGEMLAQSLGMVPQIDPNAVQQIDTGPGSQQQPEDGEQETAPFDAQVARKVQPSPTIPQTEAPAAAPVDGEDAAAQSAPTFGLVRAEATPHRSNLDPIRTLPTPPTPVTAPEKVEPVDTIWKPPITVAPDVVGLDPVMVDGDPVAPDAAPATPDRAPQLPVLGPETGPAAPSIPTPPTNPEPAPVLGTDPGVRAPLPDPVTPVPPTAPEQPAPVSRDPRFIAAPVTPRQATKPSVPVKPGSGRELPPAPPLQGQPTTTPELAATPTPDRVVWPDPATRVNLGQDSPVRISFDQPVVATPAPSGTPDPNLSAIGEVAGTTSADVVTPLEAQNVFNTVGGEALDNSAAAPAPSGTVPTQGSALAERVMQAVDLQRSQPPPRSMVVDIPEVEGLRLVVSVRAGGTVSVTPAPGWANADAYAPFADDVARVLSDRGFVMSGDGRRRGHNPYANDEQAPPRAARPTFRRPDPTDNDLRI